MAATEAGGMHPTGMLSGAHFCVGRGGGLYNGIRLTQFPGKGDLKWNLFLLNSDRFNTRIEGIIKARGSVT